MRDLSRPHLVRLILALLMASGCEHASTVPVGPPSKAELPIIAGLVVDEAANALGHDGQLRLDAPMPLSSSRREITELRARELAQAFVVTHARGMRKVLERDHGSSINVDALHVCGRVWYANSSFAPLPAEVPAVYHRIFGPRWLVTLCGAGEQPQASVAVSAYATELAIKDGRLNYPSTFGSELRVLGIPKALATGLPSSPERAVELAAKLTGARVAGVPELIAPPPGQYPQTARWRLRLEKNVTLAGHEVGMNVASTRTVSEVFVGTNTFSTPDQVQIASIDQPATLPLSYREPVLGITREQDNARPTRSVSLVRRQDFPLRYMIVGGN